MMKEADCFDYCFGQLKKRGVDRAQIWLSRSEKHELNVETGRINLLRTTYDTQISLAVIAENRKGAASQTGMTQHAVDAAVDTAVELAEGSEPDPAYDIAEYQPSEHFSTGDEVPDRDLMHTRLLEHLSYAKKRYPHTILENAVLAFNLERSLFQNSKGVSFASTKGVYSFFQVFMTKKDKKTGSFNYTWFSARAIDRPISQYGTVDALLRQSDEQIETKPVPEKFTGDVIITPDCLEQFISTITYYLGDRPLVTGTSVFRDKLGQAIAAPSFTLHSKPVSEHIASGYFITGDGYKAQDSTIIEKGILKSFLLSLYGSRKTGQARAANNGGAYVVEAGSCDLSDMITGTERGILLSRFSGDSPSDNGDFSGVAKNSCYIHDGKIQYPVSETMISGNITEALQNIGGISAERVDFGTSILPWVLFRGLTISGK